MKRVIGSREGDMRKAARLRMLAVGSLLVLTAAACGDDGEPAGGDGNGGGDGAGAGGDYTIGVSLASPTIPLYVAMAEGIRDEANELGAEVVFTEANEDPVQQLNDVQDLIAQGVDGILISPIDAEAAVPAYEDARASDIAIMSIARNTDPEVEDSFIGASWDKYGTQIAEWSCEAAGGQGQIALVKGPAGASFVEDMEDGYKEYVSSECPDMEIVYESNNVPLTPDKGVAAAQDALTANPEVKVIFANNDDLASGVIQAVDEQGISHEDIIITGFDGTPEGVQLVKDGKLDMTIALRPYHWGQLGLQTMVSFLDGEDVPALVEIETILLDEETVDDHSAEELR
jgi:ribose transport system substrate-binding protein